MMPGTVERMLAAFHEVSAPPRGVKVCGVMADLMPRHHIAALTTLVAPRLLIPWARRKRGVYRVRGAWCPWAWCRRLSRKP